MWSRHENIHTILRQPVSCRVTNYDWHPLITERYRHLTNLYHKNPSKSSPHVHLMIRNMFVCIITNQAITNVVKTRVVMYNHKFHRYGQSLNCIHENWNLWNNVIFTEHNCSWTKFFGDFKKKIIKRKADSSIKKMWGNFVRESLSSLFSLGWNNGFTILDGDFFQKYGHRFSNKVSHLGFGRQISRALAVLMFKLVEIFDPIYFTDDFKTGSKRC